MQQIDRIDRVNALVKREVAALIASELDDPRVIGVTVTGVVVSRDLRSSIVYISALNQQLDHAKVEKILNRCSGYLRKLLSKRLNMRTTPALLFKYDHSIEKGIELTHLIDALNAGHDQ